MPQRIGNDHYRDGGKRHFVIPDIEMVGIEEEERKDKGRQHEVVEGGLNVVIESGEIAERGNESGAAIPEVSIRDQA